LLKFGEFELHLERGELLRKGARIKLQEQPLKILTLLLERPGEIITREQIRERLWGNNRFVDHEHGINTAVLKLRRAIQVRGQKSISIATSPGRGYRLVVPEGNHGSWEQPKTLEVELLRAALSDGQADRLLFGFSEDIAAALGHTTGLRVKLISGPPMGELLLSVSVLDWRGQFRVAAALRDRLSSQTLWRSEYELRLRNALAVQSKIVAAVTPLLAKAPVVKPPAEPLARMPKTLENPGTLDAKGYEAYLSGRFFFAQRSPKALLEAQRRFQLACELNPNFAFAHSGLSRTHRFTVIFEMSPPREAWEQAIRSAQRALELDNHLAEAHSCMATVVARYEWRWLEGCAAYEEALRLNPNDPDTYCEYGVTLLAMGELKEGVRCLERAVRLDARYVTGRATLAMALNMLGRHQEGMGQLAEIVEGTPDYLTAWIYLGIGHLNAAQPEQAESALRRAISLAGAQPSFLCLLAHAYAAQGKTGAAEAEAATIQQQALERYVSPTTRAIAALAVSDTVEALHWVTMTVSERDVNFALYRQMRIFDAVRHEPPFLAALHSMNLTNAS
jgi:DNA-binding winged helix-turn-helix (wHTH) protein/tetratricopeptide (TPR) repeat protein